MTVRYCIALIVALAVVACSGDDGASDPVTCSRDTDCPFEQCCAEERCVDPGPAGRCESIVLVEASATIADTITAGATASFSARLVDSYRRPYAGAPVSVSVESACVECNTVVSEATTDVNGIVRGTVRSEVAELKTLVVRAGGSVSSVPFRVRPDAGVRLGLVSALENIAVGSPVPLTVTRFDAFGNPDAGPAIGGLATVTVTVRLGVNAAGMEWYDEASRTRGRVLTVNLTDGRVDPPFATILLPLRNLRVAIEGNDERLRNPASSPLSTIGGVDMEVRRRGPAELFSSTTESGNGNAVRSFQRLADGDLLVIGEVTRSVALGGSVIALTASTATTSPQAFIARVDPELSAVRWYVYLHAGTETQQRATSFTDVAVDPDTGNIQLFGTFSAPGAAFVRGNRLAPQQMCRVHGVSNTVSSAAVAQLDDQGRLVSCQSIHHSAPSPESDVASQAMRIVDGQAYFVVQGVGEVAAYRGILSAFVGPIDPTVPPVSIAVLKGMDTPVVACSGVTPATILLGRIGPTATYETILTTSLATSVTSMEVNAGELLLGATVCGNGTPQVLHLGGPRITTNLADGFVFQVSLTDPRLRVVWQSKCAGPDAVYYAAPAADESVIAFGVFRESCPILGDMNAANASYGYVTRLHEGPPVWTRALTGNVVPRALTVSDDRVIVGLLSTGGARFDGTLHGVTPTAVGASMGLLAELDLASGEVRWSSQVARAAVMAVPLILEGDSVLAATAGPPANLVAGPMDAAPISVTTGMSSGMQPIIYEITP